MPWLQRSSDRKHSCSLLPTRLLVQPRVRVGDRGMRGIRPMLATKLTRSCSGRLSENQMGCSGCFAGARSSGERLLNIPGLLSILTVHHEYPGSDASYIRDRRTQEFYPQPESTDQFQSDCIASTVKAEQVCLAVGATHFFHIMLKPAGQPLLIDRAHICASAS